MTDHEAAIVHPEWVNGRRLWMDTPMRDLIERLRFGDPVKGWEGDPRLDVYWNGIDERFELWRLEDDEQYRLVARSGPGVAFDERVIDALIGMDGRRRRISLDQQVIDHNTALDAELDRQREEWVAEEAAPRLHHAFRKDA
jgi:hypothetical protein